MTAIKMLKSVFSSKIIIEFSTNTKTSRVEFHNFSNAGQWALFTFLLCLNVGANEV